MKTQLSAEPPTDSAGKLSVVIIEATGLVVPILSGLDPYVSVSAAGITVQTEHTQVPDGSAARWGETKVFDIPKGHNTILFELCAPTALAILL